MLGFFRKSVHLLRHMCARLELPACCFSGYGPVTLVETIIQAPQASWFPGCGLRALWLPDSPFLIPAISSKARTSFSLGISAPQGSGWACSDEAAQTCVGNLSE